jgi:ferritin-like metal-binding protein YciE
MAASKSSSSTKSKSKQIPEPEELLVNELREIYSAEKQLTRALPRLSKAIESENVRQMLDRRLDEGQRLTEDLEKAFEELETSPGRKKNSAAEGLIADAQEHVQDFDKGPALDAVLIGAVQKTEHYCIAAWGTAKAFAAALGQDTVTQAMQRALKEGKSFDDELTQLAETEINPAVIRASEGGEARA